MGREEGRPDFIAAEGVTTAEAGLTTEEITYSG